jgi:hypothetical protein
MVQLASFVSQTPRISANQLGEFVFASEMKRLAILQDQKFGNIAAAPIMRRPWLPCDDPLSVGNFQVRRLFMRRVF